MMNYRKKLKNIKAMIFDVDGVFSREFIAMDKGEFYRTMNPKDGYAIKKAVDEGYVIAIITGGNSKSVFDRFKTLGVSDIFLSHLDKIPALEQFCQKYNLNEKDLLYMGDDIPDLEVMKKVGFSACPADAANEIIEIADYISDKNGGEGCVRDIVEQVLKIQEKWIH